MPAQCLVLLRQFRFAELELQVPKRPGRLREQRVLGYSELLERVMMGCFGVCLCLLASGSAARRALVRMPSPTEIVQARTPGAAARLAARVDSTIELLSSEPADRFRGELIGYLADCRARAHGAPADPRYDAAKLLFIPAAEGFQLDDGELGGRTVVIRHKPDSSIQVVVGTTDQAWWRAHVGNIPIYGPPTAWSPVQVDGIAHLARKGRYDCAGLFPSALPRGAEILRDMLSPSQVRSAFNGGLPISPNEGIYLVNRSIAKFMSLSEPERVRAVDFFFRECWLWAPIYWTTGNIVWDCGKMDFFRRSILRKPLPLDLVALTADFISRRPDGELYIRKGARPGAMFEGPVLVPRQIEAVESLVYGGACGLIRPSPEPPFPQSSASDRVRELELMPSPYQIWNRLPSGDDPVSAVKRANVQIAKFLMLPVKAQREALLGFLDQSSRSIARFEKGKGGDEHLAWDFGKLDLLMVAEGKGLALYSAPALCFIEKGERLPSIKLVSGKFPPDSGPNALAPALNSGYIATVRQWVQEGRFDWPPAEGVRP